MTNRRESMLQEAKAQAAERVARAYRILVAHGDIARCPECGWDGDEHQLDCELGDALAEWIKLEGQDAD